MDSTPPINNGGASGSSELEPNTGNSILLVGLVMCMPEPARNADDTMRSVPLLDC